jgi:hypothetical protein
MPLKKNKRNYYRILHVQPDAPPALIRASYRTLMQTLRHHPDLGGDEWNAAILNEAFCVLSDERQRRSYDARLFMQSTRGETARQTAAQRPKRQAKTGRPGPACSGPSEATSNAYTATSSSNYPKPPDYQVDLVDSHTCAFCGSSYRGALDADTDCPTCQSPLKQLEPLDFASSDQRNVHRVPLMATLTLRTAWPGPCHTAALHDLSPNGLQFTVAQDLVPGQRVRVACSILTAVAEITNRTASAGHQHRYGARFITLRYCRTSGTYFSASV